MSQQVTFRAFAPDGALFAPGAWDARIGDPVKFSGRDAVLRGAVVAGGGAYARLTVEILGGDDSGPLLTARPDAAGVIID
jgi:hypothetical protein